MFNRKGNKPDAVLSKDAAEQMLSNVFEACDYEKNRVPMEVLQSYSHYRRERFLFQKIIIALVVVMFLMLPLLFVTAGVELDYVPGTPKGKPIIQIAVDTTLPVESVTAAIGGATMDVYQGSEGVYQIRPDRNGTLVVTVTLVNKQFTTVTMEVQTVDRTPPVLVSSELKNGILEIVLNDEDGELDYSGIFGVDDKGNRVYPDSFDPERKCVIFVNPQSDMNFFVPDTCGNTLQLVLKIG